MEEMMMMMAKRKRNNKKTTSPIVIINKKLEELESELNALVDDGFSMAKTNPDDDDDRLMMTMTVPQAMHRKLAFIKSLLSAEITSNPSSHAHRRRLVRIADRVQSLESAFLDPRLGLLAWSSSADPAAGATSPAGYSSTVTVIDRDVVDGDRDHGGHDGGYDYDYDRDREIGDRGGGDDDDYSSSGLPSCSCTESCRNDEGGGEEEEERATARVVNDAVGFAMYDNPVFQADQRSGSTDEAEDEEDEDEEETVSTKVGSIGCNCNGQCCYWKGVASGAVIAALAMWMLIIVILSSGFDYSLVDQLHSRLPPT